MPEAGNDSLKMSFDPQTIEHLGVKMYSNIPSAIAELVANAYDADAKRVDVKLYDNGQNKRIEVIDDGNGMDIEDINEKFLRIGRNRRIDGLDKSPSGKRKATGKKGLGKLALFGIGYTIDITTIKKGSGQKITFHLDWDELKKSRGSDYKPSYTIEDCAPTDQGTSITLHKIKRSTAFDKEGLAVSLSKLFNLFDNQFKCFVYLNDDEAIEVDSKLRYRSIEKEQFKWNLPEFAQEIDDDYPKKGLIGGKIISTEKPLKPGLRGITLFANGRLVNEPEFFGVADSSHGFSYLTGWLDVDFVDEMDEDVIATNRKSLDWEQHGLPELQKFLKNLIGIIEKDWKKKRKEEREEVIKIKSDVDMEAWYKTLPDEVRLQIEEIMIPIVEDSELSGKQQANIVKQVHSLVPEYPNYHWRHIHPEVQDASEKAYQNQDYYTAFHEAVKRYAKKVRANSNGFEGTDRSMMGHVFGSEKRLLSVTKKCKRPDGSDFEPETLENIETGQRDLSQGVISGCRNPIAHEEHNDLRESNLFSEKDCLDALSILSHLFRRLEHAIEAQQENETPKTADTG